MTILLADDDRVQTLMLATRLKAKGFKVLAAYDATETVAVAMRTPPDVIVLDIQMPAGTGIVALQRLKASSKTGQIPVIVLSGSTDQKTIQSVKELGADEFLPKPVDLDKLFRALARVLGQPPESTPQVDGWT